MDWLDYMNQALDYIEENLSIKIDISKVAQKAGCSTYNFQRMFSFIAGVTLATYIRRRCMTMAALELTRSEIGITELAMKYGYDSPVSFARAFQSIHGINPHEARQGKGVLQSYPRISFQIVMKGDVAMKYRIETMDAFHVFGRSKSFTTKEGQNFKAIPQFWEECCEDGTCSMLGTIHGREKEEMYGISYGFDFANEEFKYMIGVHALDKKIEHLDVLEIPQMTWVKFTCEGDRMIQDTILRFYSEWLPNSGYEHAGGPEVEWYSSEEIKEDTYLCEVWMPIRPVKR